MSSSEPPAYRVEDRSILLPAYRRFVVGPVLPFIPDWVNPNTITHLGHLLNFAGVALLLALRPERGWPFIASIFLVWAYVFCDNADGAHARRTGQCSPLGEFLDHGLDLFNVAYIGYLTAMAIGAEPLAWVLIGVLVPLAASAVYWEQAETGVFRLGLLNQLEGSLALTGALLASAILGSGALAVPLVLGVSVREATAVWSVATVVFGILHGLFRVGRKAPKRLGPMVALLFFNAALLASYSTGALGAVAVVIVGSLANVAFGLRMLSFRLQHLAPSTDPIVCAGGVALLAAMALKVDARWALALTVLGGVVFALQGAAAARTSLRSIGA